MSAIPNLLPNKTELQALQEAISTRRHMTLPALQSTPLSEYNQHQPLLSWAFPTLFPRGLGEYRMPRRRTVLFDDYATHLMKYCDGRFAQHARFRYVVFNIIMRTQVTNRARYYARQRQGQTSLTLEEIQAAFAEDTPEAYALLNSITRFTGSLRGTRPF